jgi:hypothetical protein
MCFGSRLGKTELARVSVAGLVILGDDSGSLAAASVERSSGDPKQAFFGWLAPNAGAARQPLFIHVFKDLRPYAASVAIRLTPLFTVQHLIPAVRPIPIGYPR